MPTTAYEMDGVGTAGADAFVQSMKSATAQLNSIKGISDANTARSAEEASILREWQEKQNAKAMEFNRLEAEKNRNWQNICLTLHISVRLLI